MNKNPMNNINKILERFDERIIELRKKTKEFPSRAMEGLLPILEKDHKATKEYFHKELSSLIRNKRKEIKKAFVETFKGVGELWFPYQGCGDTTKEEELDAVEQIWNELITNLEKK